MSKATLKMFLVHLCNLSEELKAFAFFELFLDHKFKDKQGFC